MDEAALPGGLSTGGGTRKALQQAAGLTARTTANIAISVDDRGAIELGLTMVDTAVISTGARVIRSMYSRCRRSRGD